MINLHFIYAFACTGLTSPRMRFNLLPFSVVSTTFTICELKYGREKRIKIHYKEKGKTPRFCN